MGRGRLWCHVKVKKSRKVDFFDFRDHLTLKHVFEMALFGAKIMVFENFWPRELSERHFPKIFRKKNC
jgi:hypothetical protein